MKARSSTVRTLGLLFVAVGLVLAGCSTKPKIDWDSRVGYYTYDLAVAELGPPDKTATTSDGKLVADWIKHTSSGGVGFGVGSSRYSGNTGVGVGVSTSRGYNREEILRLTFGPDHKLVAWWKNY